MKNKINFIAFEGADGSGKTTIIDLLKKNIDKIKGYSVHDFVFTREPGGTIVGEKIREILANDNMDDRTEALLFAASRAEHVKHKILPAIESGKIVITDRFVHSSLAFQGVYKKLGVQDVWDINKFGLNNCYPDVVFYIDVPINVSFQRLEDRKNKIDRLDVTTKEEIEKIYNSYKKVFDVTNNIKTITINGDRSPNEIVDDILNILQEMLNN